MTAFDFYVTAHIALLVGAVAAAIRRAVRKEPLLYYANDALYLLLAFMLVGGGATLAAGLGG